MLCPECGKENVDGSRVCVGCGEDLARLTLPPKQADRDTLDRFAPLRDARGEQYDTLDQVETQGRGAAVLGGQYRIVRKLGEGGMGVVYLAEDMEMGNRAVVVKVLPPVLARNLRAVENLRREAMVAIKLTHPNIIRLYGFHSDGDLRFLVMEYIDGVTLEEKLAASEGGRLALDEMLAVIEKVAGALDYAHTRRRPVFHRDLKPSNIMIDRDGEVRLLDFGIAREMEDSYTRVTGKQDAPGTLPYMSPEQVRGKRPTAAMDIYSLGVVCYECLNGQPPFHTGDVSYQILHEPPEPLSRVPGNVNQALQRVLAKEASGRPAAARELVAWLKNRGGDVPDSSRSPGTEPRTGQGIANSLGMKMVWIPAGQFRMGSKSGGKDERPVHPVRISRDFWMGEYGVTNAQYQRFVQEAGYDGSRESDSDYLRHHRDRSQYASTGESYPIVCVSWNNAVAFCRWLTESQRRAGRLPEGYVYRLPTEAEWEYAARGGATSRGYKYAGSNRLADVAWYDGNSGGKTHPVGQKRPNELGLYDMSGNVWEWCHDCYDGDYYGKSPPSDPRGPSAGSGRVLRGGSWNYNHGYCRSASRDRGTPQYSDDYYGFRVVASFPMD